MQDYRLVWKNTPLPPPPPKFAVTRPHQEDAIQAILEAFETHDLVVCDAPTGSGKTWIAEEVRRRMTAAKLIAAGLYLCSDIPLSHQFATDFSYSSLLKGKANYATETGPTKGLGAVTCEDCTAKRPNNDDPDSGQACMYCRSIGTCPYQVARRAALRNPIAVMNTSYFLREANGPGMFGANNKRDLIIVDECDVLERTLLSYVELEIGPKELERVEMKLPDKGVRRPKVIAWLHDYQVRTEDWLAANREQLKPKQADAIDRKLDNVAIVVRELQAEQVRVDEGAEDMDNGEMLGRWVRDYGGHDRGWLNMKPIKVAKFGPKYLWRHGKKWLLMSASVGSAEELVDSLGGGHLDWTLVTVPSTFPVENRPIIMAPVMSVIFANRNDHVKELGPAIVRILDRHEGERVLVHCVSYALAKGLSEYVFNALMERGIMRPVITYGERGRKDEALQDYLRQPGSVLFAPSMDRGVDLPDDLCRVQIVAKMPALALGDRQVSERKRQGREGQQWYSMQTIRTFTQMIGRGVRHEKDWCVTYVLDRQFGGYWMKDKALFPGWLAEAVDTGRDIRWVLRD